MPRIRKAMNRKEVQEYKQKALAAEAEKKKAAEAKKKAEAAKKKKEAAKKKESDSK
jgi:hypothetical protein